jgi:hypothetical protein
MGSESRAACSAGLWTPSSDMSNSLLSTSHESRSRAAAITRSLRAWLAASFKISSGVAGGCPSSRTVAILRASCRTLSFLRSALHRSRSRRRACGTRSGSEAGFHGFADGSQQSTITMSASSSDRERDWVTANAIQNSRFRKLAQSWARRIRSSSCCGGRGAVGRVVMARWLVPNSGLENAIHFKDRERR